jgi:hypothetical protein
MGNKFRKVWVFYVQIRVEIKGNDRDQMKAKDEKIKQQKKSDAKNLGIARGKKRKERKKQSIPSHPVCCFHQQRRNDACHNFGCLVYQHFKLEKKPPFFFCGDVAADSDSEKRSFSDSLVMFGAGAD